MYIFSFIIALKEIKSRKLHKNAKCYQSLNSFLRPRRRRRRRHHLRPSTQHILAQQRQSEGRVAMTTRPHGRLRLNVQDARWRPLVVDDAQRTLLPRDFTSNVGELQSGEFIKPLVVSSSNI